MRLLWRERSNPLAWWWAVLSLASAANIALWFVLYRQFHMQPAGGADSASGIQLMLFLCAAYVFGCALAWQFREPVATLVENGVTVGRHYAGPTWELADGSVIVAKVAGRAPGSGPNDIPLLKLEVTSRRGAGRLSEITTIQRLNTKGGVAEGVCEKAGTLLSVPYSADYVLLKKPD